MRRLAATAVIFACCVAITPGLRELLLDAVHSAVDGHVAHASGCDDASEAEHGCTGPFHACSCHASTPMAGPILDLRVGTVPRIAHVRYLRVEPRDGPPGHDRQLLRPPAV